jgi:hypothetical protein
MRRLIGKLNMNDWSAELDQLLQSVIVQSYFNFDIVCVEINQKARELAANSANPIGARDRFTTEHCRLRWSYIHLVVSLAKPTHSITSSSLHMCVYKI